MNEPIDIAEKRAATQPVDQWARLVKDLVLEAQAHFHHKYRVIVDDVGALSCVQIASPGVLRPVSEEAIFNDMVRHFLGRIAVPQIKKSIIPAWKARVANEGAIRASSIAPLVFHSEATTAWAWQRLDFDPTEIECPVLLTKMLRRTSPEEGRSLVLWLGSLLDYNFPRSQYLYLHGDGNDGKSTLIAMLIKLLGTQGVAMMRSDDFGDAHSTTVLEGARLAIFADENSASFMSRGRFKALTGDDTLTINPKGLPRRNIALHCKVLVASNYPPHVQGGRADLRRIIPVQLTPIPPNESNHGEGQAFIASGSAIMQHCYGEFRKWQLENPNQMIPVGESAIDDVAADSMQTEIDTILDSLLMFGPDYEMTASAMINLLRPVCGARAGLQSAYHAIKKKGAKRVQSGKDRLRVWKGVTIKT